MHGHSHGNGNAKNVSGHYKTEAVKTYYHKTYYTNSNYNYYKKFVLDSIYNGNIVVKEIIFDGITTYSTDFALMGKKAAHYVLTREKIQETLPTILIRRNSL